MNAIKRLIVNADDLGRTSGINRGVFQAHERGIVTSATLMVNYAAAEEVAGLAAANPNMGIGLHIALTGGKPVLPPSRVPSLVDTTGALPAKPEGLAEARADEILAEARAQLARFRQLVGRWPTLFDRHHHAHRLPAVLEALVTLAWETGTPGRIAAPAVAERLRREGIRTTDYFVEDFYGEAAGLEGLVSVLSALGLGTTELMCHPAVVDDELRSSSSYAEPRMRELEALTHRDARQALQAAGVRLIHFGEI
jgi:chitin disaccharide deacetylase